MPTIKQLTKKVHEISKSKGWWSKQRSPLEIHMLIVSEIAEATEEVRNGRPHMYQYHQSDDKLTIIEPKDKRWSKDKKPEGELVELADAVIRIMDYCGYMNWDLEKAILEKASYNKKRSYRHGNKKF